MLLSLWEEGLAVYVSHLLNPNASYAELLLGFPEGLFERAWRGRTLLARDLSQHLTSTNEGVNRRYFTPWTGDARVPGRAGYVIGYVVVRELVKRYPLAYLLRPPGEGGLRELVGAQLGRLADLPDDYLLTPPRLPRT